MTEIPETYEEFTWKLLKSLPTKYTRIDLVADTYLENSIKGAERFKRESSQEIIIRSPKSKIPRDFNGFLKNGKNKTRILCDYLLETYHRHNDW